MKKSVKTENNIYQESEKPMSAKEKTPHIPPARRRKISLRSVHDIKRLWASVMNELRMQTIDPQIASKLLYGVNVGINLFELVDLSREIDELKRRADYAEQTSH